MWISKKARLKIRQAVCLLFCLAGLLCACGTREPVKAEPEESAGDAAGENRQVNLGAAKVLSAGKGSKSETGKRKSKELAAKGKSVGSGASRPSKCGKLHVEGSVLADTEGNPVQLRGISTHGLAWFSEYVNDECFQELHEEWGANVVRLAMYTAESGGYCTGGDKERLKKLVSDGVGYAVDNDLYVILDWHILSDGNPNTYKKQAKEFFGEMAKTYADCDNVLYEICNEPNGGTSWREIKAYAEEVIRVIRKWDPDGVILVGTPNWSQDVDRAAADPIDEENIMYTFHFYAATHKEDLRRKMISAIEDGLPVFVTEFGICDASGSGAADEKEAELWIRALDRRGISYVAWNLSNKNETSALLKSTCSKRSGFQTKDLSSSGRWLKEVLSSKKRQTGTKARTEPKKSVAGAASGTGKEAAAKKGLTYEAVLVNSWDSEGKCYDQYALTIYNGGKKDITEWSVRIPFQNPVELSDGWNGTYTVKKNVITIRSKDYNGRIPSGGKADGVGFIVCGDGRTAIKQD